MSQSHFLPQAVDRPGKPIRRELFNSQQPRGESENPHSDENMMYAWSH